jgi:hypothetical protein
LLEGGSIVGGPATRGDGGPRISPLPLPSGQAWALCFAQFGGGIGRGSGGPGGYSGSLLPPVRQRLAARLGRTGPGDFSIDGTAAARALTLPIKDLRKLHRPTCIAISL